MTPYALPLPHDTDKAHVTVVSSKHAVHLTLKVLISTFRDHDLLMLDKSAADLSSMLAAAHCIM